MGDFELPIHIERPCHRLRYFVSLFNSPMAAQPPVFTWCRGGGGGGRHCGGVVTMTHDDASRRGAFLYLPVLCEMLLPCYFHVFCMGLLRSGAGCVSVNPTLDCSASCLAIALYSQKYQELVDLILTSNIHVLHLVYLSVKMFIIKNSYLLFPNWTIFHMKGGN